jgi:hypothetical protein
MPRAAQVWAQQILAGTIVWLKHEPNKEMPKKLPGFLAGQDGITLVLSKGQAIRLCQEVNLAIKQHNQYEDRARLERQEMQANTARTDDNAKIPDYEPEKIYWTFKYTEIGEGAFEINLNYLTHKTPKTKSMLAQLGDMFAKHSAPNYTPKEDPFETWLTNAPAHKEDNMSKNFSTEVQAGNIQDNRPTIPGLDQHPSNNGEIPSAPVKKASYTREELIAKGWTFDDQGKPIPPKRA